MSVLYQCYERSHYYGIMVLYARLLRVKLLFAFLLINLCCHIDVFRIDVMSFRLERQETVLRIHTMSKLENVYKYTKCDFVC